MLEHTRVEPKTVAAAERQMQAWAFAQQVTEQTQRQTTEQTLRVDPPRQETDEIGEFITISREAGACGSQVAELVGREMGWEVLDKNLLDYVAEQYKLCRSQLEFVDETTTHWASDMLGAWLDPTAVPHHKYVVHLGRIVLCAAREGNVVLVGRGAQFLLPRGQGLSVRLIAPEKYRVERIMERHSLNAAKARRFIAEVDRGRREFVRRFFHRNIDDPHLYDLVINVERFGPVGTVEQIIGAYPRP